MKRLFLFFILNILFISSVYSMTLTGSAEYNVESAKTEAFHGVKYAIGRNSLSDYLKDPNYIQNYTYVLRGETKIFDRMLASFSDGTYGVRFDSDPYHNYYYDKTGKLFKVDVLNKPQNEYPHTSVAYDSKGNIINSTFVISKDEQYIFNPQKKLVGHWVGQYCYDANNRIQMTREYSR